MKVQLHGGEMAEISDEDAELVLAHRWSVKRTPKSESLFYAQTNVMTPAGYRPLYMHHLVMGKPPRGMVCDHINGNGIDNRRENLRIISQSHNLINAAKFRSGVTSKYKGVSWDKKSRKWAVNISINKKQTYLGIFENEDDAARAYDAAAREHYGDVARLNLG